MSTGARSSEGPTPVIEVRGLKHTYRKSKKISFAALHGIDLTVWQGEILGLVGPDGAGKSTLLKALGGLIRPSEGSVTLEGEPLEEVRERIGYVSPAGGVYPDLSVAENLSYVAGLHSIASGPAEARADELLKRLQLEQVADRLAITIGGGRRRMLALASALLPDPDFLFLDEPTTAIDPMSRRACWEIFSERARAGKTIVLVTQFASDADQCTRIAYMAGGTISRIGQPVEMRAQLAETKPGDATESRLGDVFESAIAGLEKDRPPPFPFAKPLRPLRQSSSGGVAIRTSELTKSFGKIDAVQGINFDVPYGEIFGLVGESGTGKTTILRMLAGLLTPDSGSSEIAGEDSHGGLAYESRRHIGYFAQSFSLFSELTVDDNLNFLAGIHQMQRAEFEIKRQWVYELLSLQQGGKTPVASLDDGDKRRLALAAAVLHEPEVVLLDGPTSAVDPVMRRALWEMFEGFATRGAAVLMATSYLTEAERCDRVGFLSDGKLLAVGKPAELKSAQEANVVEFDAGPSALAVLRGMLKPWRVWPVAGRVHAIVDGDAQTGTREISNRLSEAGIVMERVSTRPLSLEDVSVLLTAGERDRKLAT
ncbi:MAG TPA: ATP-binding cassette domain-containing protein [Pyrinomonadaceae bacterium]|nr:ATP-binding cassette domain-containing protein [Pyrinomonadaceae bacterium]